MRKVLQIGGFVAAAVLIVFGVVAIVMGVNGRNTVQNSLTQEHIVGSPDMTPALITAEARKAGLSSTTSFPTVSVAGKAIDNGTKARAFAGYMRIDALEASGGLTYSQMPRFASQDGKGTNDPAKALQANGRPVDNAARNLWVTETALSTALNASYMAESLRSSGSWSASLCFSLGSASGSLLPAERSGALSPRPSSPESALRRTPPPSCFRRRSTPQTSQQGVASGGPLLNTGPTQA